jgi:hypothetical protein
MAGMSKNSRVGRVRGGFYEPDKDCLRRFNYYNGAGWRTKNTKGVQWGIKSKKRGRGY